MNINLYEHFLPEYRGGVLYPATIGQEYIPDDGYKEIHTIGVIGNLSKDSIEQYLFDKWNTPEELLLTFYLLMEMFE